MAWRQRERGSGWSLRRRLLLTVIATSAGLWLASLAVFIAVSWWATSEFFDEALEEGARLVLQLNAGTGGGTDIVPRESGSKRKLRMYYQLVAADGQVLLRSKDTPQAAFVAEVMDKKSFSNVFAGGELWRVYVRRGEGGISAQVAQPMEERLDLLEDVTEALVWPALGLLLLLALLTWLVIRRLLRPLEQTAARIAAKSPQDLSPLDAHHPPRELQPVLRALNGLLQRLQNALDSERRFTSDAAHELRTPLAALRTRVQLIERQLALPAPQLAALRADVDRCTALVHNLLILARLDPQQPLAREPVALSPLLDRVYTQCPNLHGRAPRRVLEVAQVHAAPELLGIALRNLLDNAARYGGADARIEIRATALPTGGVRLAVRDDGPGVPLTERAHLGQRFYRVLGTGVSGSGLGLSIVARIAALHGASMRFEDGLADRGLGVVLDFPPA